MNRRRREQQKALRKFVFEIQRRKPVRAKRGVPAANPGCAKKEDQRVMDR